MTQAAFKTRIGGMKHTVRPMGPDEIINERTVFINRSWGHGPQEILNKLKAGKHSIPVFKSGCVGEIVGDHPDNLYLEITSKHFKFFEG